MTLYQKYYIIYDHGWVKYMNKKYLEKQIITAKENYNYFFTKIVISIFRTIIKLSIVLLIGIIFNSVIFNIFQLLYIIYLLYDINNILNYYFDIIKDIKNTLNIEDNKFEIDLNLMYNNFFSRVTK